MRNFLVFLFIFVFSPLAFNVSGNVGSPEIDKLKGELVLLKENNKPTPKTLKDTIEESLSDWKTAEATFYDPYDEKQTKKNPDGLGTSGRRIVSGSIALGSSFTEKFINDKNFVVFIEIKDCNIKTPYGKSEEGIICRVDDKMGPSFCKEGEYHVDFYKNDLDYKHRRIGKFPIQFRVFKIVKTAGSYSLTSCFLI